MEFFYISFNKTALHLAIEKNKPKIVALLMNISIINVNVISVSNSIIHIILN